MSVRKFLRVERILGRRAMVTFGVVTFLVAALLATVNITSRYALKVYVDDQLRRTPWDLAVYQKGAPGESLNILPAKLAAVENIRQIETLVFLRAQFAEDGRVMSEVDGRPLRTPWMCLMAASDLSTLPPQASYPLSERKKQGATGPAAVLALVGPERAMGAAFHSLQGSRGFSIKVNGQVLFDTPIHSVIRLERDELNRWLMDQTGSISYVPYIAAVLLMPFDAPQLTRFDSVVSGAVQVPVDPKATADLGELQHVQLAQYEPEVAYLGRMDRNRLISGWDITRSLANVRHLNSHVHWAAREAVELAARGGDRADIVLAHNPGETTTEPEGDHLGDDSSFYLDSTTAVLLDRMEQMSKLVGLLTVLVALPLLWMAWVLAANLSGLLMLNERRKLGLMRLRGIPGKLLGRVFLVAVLVGGFVGGLSGLITGYVVPLLIYERGRLPLYVLTRKDQILLSIGFLAVTLLLALFVSRRLVRYATTISPLEASGRIAVSEVTRARIAFGWLQAIALGLGAYVLARWIYGLSLAPSELRWAQVAEQMLDFLGLPLFVYGLATFIASHGTWIRQLMTPLMRPIGGVLGKFAVRHISVKPHRTAAFLLIVALMASVSLYPTITERSFTDRAERGARVQLGTDWQLILNAPDLAEVSRFRGGLAEQMSVLKPEIEKVAARLAKVPGVTGVTYLIEGVLGNFYIPGHGLTGVPIYFSGDSKSYLQEVYSEPEVGVTARFSEILDRIDQHEVATSPPVAEFWETSPGTPMMVGLTRTEEELRPLSAGILAHLPGLPPRGVTDRQGYVQARVDYLNHLFSSNAYLVAGAANPKIADMQVLIPRVIMLVAASGTSSGASKDEMRDKLLSALPVQALEWHNLDDEMGKLGTDMYISLALANMRIYLGGGFFLALIAIVAIGMANYAEDRRTMGLLRIRGASPTLVRRFLTAVMLSPAFLGMLAGGIVAMVAGFGLANHVWDLRELQTVVQLLPTHLVASWVTVSVALLILASLFAVSFGLSSWEFRRSASEHIQES